MSCWYITKPMNCWRVGLKIHVFQIPGLVWFVSPIIMVHIALIVCKSYSLYPYFECAFVHLSSCMGAFWGYFVEWVIY